MSDVTVYNGIRSYYPGMKVKMNHNNNVVPPEMIAQLQLCPTCRDTTEM
jgi:hypothetical protein